MDFFDSADEGTIIKHYDDDSYDVIVAYRGLDLLINHENRILYDLSINDFIVKNIKTTIDSDNIWRNTFHVVTKNF
jgi:hypothetical protein